ncbi:SulP family inorganic anion transporter [Rapidithrix thailandica]|uniref:SulP family inorganic anion transporter n=1 Tax=Rapidithrix thailandica TaxID=413964 RepID=A0AAW9RSX9_9BACT
MKNNLSSYLSYTKNDLPAGLVVFLVALPLCLGIALASGAPLFAGIITGIVGGIVVGFLSGSSLSVSGPAAGLTVIVLNAITDLGSYEVFLLALVIAGALQLALGFFKAGIIGLYFPSSVIKGMLAAIGLILILKQIPHFFGVNANAVGEAEYSIWNLGSIVSYLGVLIDHIHVGALLVGGSSILLMILWDRPALKKIPAFKLIPKELVAVCFGLGLNSVFAAMNSPLAITSSHLVNLPVFESLGSVKESFSLPDFSQLTNPDVYIVAVTLAIIASLETLLSVEAVDKMDPAKRRTPQNRELKAQGVGNLICGLIGGLPMTAVIVRSTANLNANAKSKMSAIYHGIFLAAAVGFIPFLLNKIPLASLAAVLILVGFKLTKPALYKQQIRLGIEQFIPFIVTIVAILATDLLTGIIIGMAVGVFFILKANYKVPYFFDKESTGEGDQSINIRLSEHVSFLNKASLQLTLDHLPHNSKVVIDGTSSKNIDVDALEVIHNFKSTAKERGIMLDLKAVPELV